MGLNTIVLLHNDHLHTLEENAEEFTQELCTGVQNAFGEKVNIGTGNAANVAQVITTTHSSYDYFVRVQGNTAKALGYQNVETDDLEAMANFLREQGYTVEKN